MSVENIVQPELFDDLEVYGGDELFADGFYEGGSQEYAYPLTSYVPFALTPADRKAFPAEAVRWIVPSLDRAVIVRMVNIFSTVSIPKVPAPFRHLYLRMDRRGRINPTPLQEAIWDTVVSKNSDDDGRAKPRQVAMLPVLRYNAENDQWVPSIAELGKMAWDELRERNADTDDATNGLVSIRTRPIMMWKSKDGKTITVRFEKTFDGDVQEIVSKAVLLDAKQYVGTRAKITEEWFKTQYTQAPEAAVDGTMTDRERFTDAARNLTTVQLRGILKSAGVEVESNASKMQLLDLVQEHQEETMASVMDLGTIDENNPPF